jgi:hypothetical protein
MGGVLNKSLIYLVVGRIRSIDIDIYAREVF